MGMYTELLFKAEMKRDIPQGVVDTLLYLTGQSEDENFPKDHEFFHAERWRYVLRCSSYYFVTGDTKFWHDNIPDRWFLVANSSVKNYDSDLEKFIDWVLPHVDPCCEFLGYTMYEEADRPNLLFYSELMSPAASA